jgi:hypothetical protein
MHREFYDAYQGFARAAWHRVPHVFRANVARLTAIVERVAPPRREADVVAFFRAIAEGEEEHGQIGRQYPTIEAGIRTEAPTRYFGEGRFHEAMYEIAKRSVEGRGFLRGQVRVSRAAMVDLAVEALVIVLNSVMDHRVRSEWIRPFVTDGLKDVAGTVDNVTVPLGWHFSSSTVSRAVRLAECIRLSAGTVPFASRTHQWLVLGDWEFRAWEDGRFDLRLTAPEVAGLAEE